MKRRTLIILSVIAVIILAAGAYAWREYHRVQPDTADVKAAFAIPAPELLKAFRDDENKANRQYNDKAIDVSGTIVSVQGNDTPPTVQLDGQSAMGGVVCQFEASHRNELKDLQAGQAVTIRGVCTGMLMDVVLVRCVVSKTGNTQ